MQAASLIEEIRFGYGPRAGTTPTPGGLEPERVLAQFAASDPAAEAWDRPPLADRLALVAQAKAEKASAVVAAPAPTDPAMADPAKPDPAKSDPSITNPAMTAPAMTADAAASPVIEPNFGKQLKAILHGDEESFVSRPAVASLGFVERLVNLWANRITVSNTGNNLGYYVQSFRDDAVRPNIAGRYADLLLATLWHPAMQIYLTQVDSIGPDSPVGIAKGKGLNENLAREFLELHTMGHGYDQTDVTELAKLLAGMFIGPNGPNVNKNRAQPGKKHILGTSFGNGVAQINALVETVAHRPETAEAVAFFLARHFIADVPPADLVAALAKTYLANDTELVPVYRTLLQHPSAAAPTLAKVRTPQEFAAASLRLVGLSGQEKDMPGFAKDSLQVPLAMGRMGQLVFRALRPDGWPEVASGWMTPPMMAGRVDWAVDLARATGDRVDPSAMVDFALGDMATPLLHRAVAGAEQRWEGLAVLIASPEFSRR